MHRRPLLLCVAAAVCALARGTAGDYADGSADSALGVAVSVAAGGWAAAEHFVGALQRRLSAR